MEKEREGFPITSLREVDTLLKAQHPNVVTVRVSISFLLIADLLELFDFKQLFSIFH